MVRTPLTPEERERGERLGRLLREARGGRSMADIAGVAGISAETLRKIETGRAPTPAFFTVAALARALGLSMDEIAGAWAQVTVGVPQALPARTSRSGRRGVLCVPSENFS